MFRKILFLLDRRERWKLVLLLVLATLSGAAQMAGVGSIMPFVSVLTNPEIINESAFIGFLYDFIGFQSSRRFLLVLGAGVLAAFVLSNALMALTQWFNLRFVWWNQYRLSQRLLDTYVFRHYLFHLGRNSASTGSNVLTESQTFATQVLLPLVQAAAFGITGLFLLALLVWLSPLMFGVVVTVVGGGYLLIYLAVRTLLLRVGERRMQANANRFKAANEAFGAIKEVKASGNEDAFLAAYRPAATAFALARAKEDAISQLPRYMIEVIGMGSVLVVILLLALAGADLSAVVPMASVYAFAGYRLVPAVQHVYRGVAHMRFNRVVVDSLHRDLQAAVEVARQQPGSVSPSSPLPFREAIRLEKVTFTYPEAREPAIRGVSLTLQRGTSAAFVGATGAGKTTLVDIILGLLEPQQGTLTVDGIKIDQENMRAWQRNIGYVPQHIYLMDDTVARNIAFGVLPTEIDAEKVERAARIANIHNFVVDELPEGYQTQVGERGVRLSGGQRQRIGIARALYHDPAVLVLDEATSALDGSTEEAVQQAITAASTERTLIVIAHRLSTVRECDVLYLLDQGRMAAQGTYDRLLETSPRFQEMAGVA